MAKEKSKVKMDEMEPSKEGFNSYKTVSKKVNGMEYLVAYPDKGGKDSKEGLEGWESNDRANRELMFADNEKQARGILKSFRMNEVNIKSLKSIFEGQFGTFDWPIMVLKNGILVDKKTKKPVFNNAPKFDSVADAEKWLEDNDERGNVQEAKFDSNDPNYDLKAHRIDDGQKRYKKASSSMVEAGQRVMDVVNSAEVVEFSNNDNHIAKLRIELTKMVTNLKKKLYELGESTNLI